MDFQIAPVPLRGTDTCIRSAPVPPSAAGTGVQYGLALNMRCVSCALAVHGVRTRSISEAHSARGKRCERCMHYGHDQRDECDVCDYLPAPTGRSRTRPGICRRAVGAGECAGEWNTPAYAPAFGICRRAETARARLAPAYAPTRAICTAHWRTV